MAWTGSDIGGLASAGVALGAYIGSAARGLWHRHREAGQRDQGRSDILEELYGVVCGRPATAFSDPVPGLRDDVKRIRAAMDDHLLWHREDGRNGG